MAQASTSTDTPITSIDDARFDKAIRQYCSLAELTFDQFSSCVADLLGSDCAPVPFSKISQKFTVHACHLESEETWWLPGCIFDCFYVFENSTLSPKKERSHMFGLVIERLAAIYHLERLAKEGEVHNSYIIDGVTYNLTDPLPSLKIIMDVPMEIVPAPAPLPVPVDIDAEIKRHNDMKAAVEKLYAFYKCLLDDSATMSKLIAAADEAEISRDQMLEFHEKKKISPEYMKTFCVKYFTGLTVCSYYSGAMRENIVSQDLVGKDIVLSRGTLKMCTGTVKHIFLYSIDVSKNNFKLFAVPTAFLAKDFDSKTLSDEQKINSYWYDGEATMYSFRFLRELLSHEYSFHGTDLASVEAFCVSSEFAIELFDSRFCGKIFELYDDFNDFVKRFVKHITGSQPESLDAAIDLLKHVKDTNQTIYQAIAKQISESAGPFPAAIVEVMGAENILPNISHVNDAIAKVCNLNEFYLSGDTTQDCLSRLAYYASLKAADGKWCISKAVFCPILVKILENLSQPAMDWYIANVDCGFHYRIMADSEYDAALRRGICKKIGTSTRSGSTIIYILSINVLDINNNIRLVLDDFQANKYQSYAVIFVPSVTDDIKRELSRYSISVSSWDPFPIALTPNLWVLSNNHLAGVNKIVEKFGYLKKIIGKTDREIKSLCLELKQFFLDNSNNHNDYHLIIFDRRRIQLPVLIQDFSYFGILTDHCDMRYNTVKIDNVSHLLEDAITHKYGLEMYADVISKFRQKLDELEKTQPVIPKKASTKELSSLTASVNTFSRSKDSIAMHLELCSRFFSKLEAAHAVYELQYQIITSTNVKPEIICMINDNYPVHMICSLMVLYNLYLSHDEKLLNLVGERYGIHAVDCIINLTKRMAKDQTLCTTLYPYIMSMFDCTGDHMNYLCAWCVSQIIQTSTITHLLPNEQYKINMLPPPPLHRPESAISPRSENYGISNIYGAANVLGSMWNYAKSYIVNDTLNNSSVEKPTSKEENYIIYLIGETTYSEVYQIQKLYPDAIIVCDAIVTCKQYVTKLIDWEYYSQAR